MSPDTENKPRFSDDPRGGVYIDDGVSPVSRVEDEQKVEVPAPTPSTEAPTEVSSNG